MREPMRTGALVATLALLGACGRSSTTDAKQGGTQATVVFDIGGRGDQGFNDGAATGAERAARATGATIRFVESPAQVERVTLLRDAARSGADLVVAVGFLAGRAATEVAREFPQIHFAVVDYSLPVDDAGRAMTPPPNLVGLSFREEEGSFLVGALAGLATRTHAVGFVGGMSSPTIRRFEAGYAAGVRRVCATCTVNVHYLGATPAAFRDAAGGRSAALAQYRAGADIVFHASGESGHGVFQAARETGRYAIGVDLDQSALAPGHTLTSMLKRIDVAVEEVIRREAEGRFVGGIESLGLAEGGVGYAWNASSASLAPADARVKVETLRAALAAGFLSAPSSAR